MSQSQILNLDYSTRGLDICQFCGLRYNVGERIPRILVHCGHTLCTSCIQALHHNNRVRCPICRKLVKQLESAERLPLNINILYEVVEKDPILSKTNFDFDEQGNANEDEDAALQEKLCAEHPERVKHFYCSNHLTVFCRECIRLHHSDDACFVVDLYEIQRMRKLQMENITKNVDQARKRNKA